MFNQRPRSDGLKMICVERAYYGTRKGGYIQLALKYQLAKK